MISSWEHQILIKGYTIEGSVEFYVLFKITQQEDIIKWKPRVERAWEGQDCFILVCGTKIKHVTEFLPHMLIVINTHVGGWEFKWRDRESSDWIVVEKTRMGSRHWKAAVH